MNGRGVRTFAGITGGLALLAGGLVIAGPVAAETRGGGSPASRAPVDDVQWSECTAENLAGLDCARIEVPLDYDKPNGRTIEIAITRLASTNPEQRTGVLLTNPGGPGSAGRRIPLAIDGLGISDEIRAKYDIIGFDPRGIGQSTPVTCDWTQEEQAVFYPTHPMGPADVADRLDTMAVMADKCAQADNNGVLPHITTENTARDMDVIRRALEEEKISYLGYSYGTYLGAVYTQLFPQHSGRFVLDGAIDPGLVWHEQFRLFAPGGEAAFRDFAAWAAARHDTYGLGETAGAVRETYLRQKERLQDGPVAGVTSTSYQWGVFDRLYGSDTYPGAAELIQSVAQGDAAAAREQLAAPWSDRRASSSSSAVEVPADNALAAQAGIICNDASWPTSEAHYQKSVRTYGEKFPLFGAMMANSEVCSGGWELGPQDPVTVDSSVSSTALIVQNLRDPATPLQGAQGLRDAMGDRARMVTLDEAGHGTYLFEKNACVTELVDTYLLEGELPDKDQHCQVESGASTRAASGERERALDLMRGKQTLR